MKKRVDWEDELSFWKSELSGKGLYSSDTLSRFDLSRPTWEYPASLEPLLASLGREKNRLARVADLGSGPASILSYGHREKRFDLVAVDPLADKYLKLMARNGLEPTSPMVALPGERLVERFGTEHFDFIWSFNAIDHCQDPRQLFDAVVDATRPGGVILIQCWEKEGTEAGWGGLHKHDFSKSPDGRMVCTTQRGVATVLHDDRLEMLPPDFVELPNQPKSDHREWLVFAYERR